MLQEREVELELHQLMPCASSDALELMRRLLAFDPFERPTAAEALVRNEPVMPRERLSDNTRVQDSSFF